MAFLFNNNLLINKVYADENINNFEELPNNYELFSRSDVSNTNISFKKQEMIIAHNNINVKNKQYFGSLLRLDYTQKVEKIRIGKTPTKLLIDIANYVKEHLNEPIDIEALAKAMFISRTHPAVKFKKETGMTLTDFILKEKVEEGKKLLKYTDRSISAIAIFLGFSSQSHFSNVFHKYTNKSPNEYRKFSL